MGSLWGVPFQRDTDVVMYAVFSYAVHTSFLMKVLVDIKIYDRAAMTSMGQLPTRSGTQLEWQTIFWMWLLRQYCAIERIKHADLVLSSPAQSLEIRIKGALTELRPALCGSLLGYIYSSNTLPVTGAMTTLPISALVWQEELASLFFSAATHTEKKPAILCARRRDSY